MSISALAQSGEKRGLLLPHQVHISGVVVDANGDSIPGAIIAHANSRSQAAETDAGGRFTVDTDAPMVVIEKPGYLGHRIRTSEAHEAHVTLVRLSESFPVCEETNPLIGIDEGTLGGFFFRRIAGIKSTQPTWDVDYVARNYSISVGRKKYVVLHGAGPMWGGSELPDELVWKSVEFDQRDYEAGGVDVVDAHGTMPDGTRWRHLGVWTTSASYEKVPQEAAAVLDRLLDSACWKPSPKK